MAKIFFFFFLGEICAGGREEEEGEGAPIDLAEAECRAVLDAAEGGGSEGLLEQLRSDTGAAEPLVSAMLLTENHSPTFSMEQAQTSTRCRG